MLPGACLLILDPDHYVAPKSKWYDIPDRVLSTVSSTNSLCGGLTERDGFVLTYGLQKRVVASFVSAEYNLDDSVKLQFETELVETDSNVLAWDDHKAAYMLDTPSIGVYNYLQNGFLCSYEMDTLSNGVLQVSFTCNNFESHLDSLSIQQKGESLWSQRVPGYSSYVGEALVSPKGGDIELVYHADTVIVEQLTINHLFPQEVAVAITEVAPRESVEWLEIHNKGMRSLSLYGWALQAGDDRIVIKDGVLNAGEYMVLSSFNEFASFDYLKLSKRVTMSNYSDTLYLLAPWGAVDSMSWSYKEFEHWDRETLNRGAHSLFLCEASPGAKTACDEQGDLALSISPRIISPDGDGVDDQVHISLGSAFGVEYELTLWALSGDLLYTHRSTEPDTLIWSGIDRHGNRVPRGPVLVHLRSGDRETRGEVILWR